MRNQILVLFSFISLQLNAQLINSDSAKILLQQKIGRMEEVKSTGTVCIVLGGVGLLVSSMAGFRATTENTVAAIGSAFNPSRPVVQESSKGWEILAIGSSIAVTGGIIMKIMANASIRKARGELARLDLTQEQIRFTPYRAANQFTCIRLTLPLFATVKRK